MKRLKEHWYNLVDYDKYGGLFEDIIVLMLAGGTLFFFIYSVLKSGGVI